MIIFDRFSYSFPDKELYDNVSFSIDEGSHCAFIGSNGTGKTTLANIIMNDEKYMYDGRLTKEEGLRTAYVSQYAYHDKNTSKTVFEFLAEDFLQMLRIQEDWCEKMSTTTDLETVYERYQECLDAFAAVDGDNYESNIKKELSLAGLADKENLDVSLLSGGEYKLLGVIRQMMKKPDLLIMDEPDVFLDFFNLCGLKELINSYKGTILVITHNRFLLNNCFDKILHLENGDIQEFDGNYFDYKMSLLLEKIEQKTQSVKEEEEIKRQEKLVEKIRNEATYIDNAGKGRSLKARVSYLERLKARQIKAPFVNLRQPDITLPELEAMEADIPILSVTDYSLSFEKMLLENVSFEIMPGEKVAIVGPNGTGKSTLMKDIIMGGSKAVRISDYAVTGLVSQDDSRVLNEENTVMEEFEEKGLTREEVYQLLERYCFERESLNRKISVLSGGERNLLQLAKLTLKPYNLLLLDEPTSHLDTYSQEALEKAIVSYKGTILMVSHDFYSVANCMDYVLYVENNTLRRMSIRAFRKMIYANHFDKEYLEMELLRKDTEMNIEKALKDSKPEKALQILERFSENMDK